MESESSTDSRRPYHSPRRQEQARQTRRVILEAARPLFIQRGYAGTSMGDISRAARVSLKTVEAIFGTKAKVLTALREISIVGDDEAVPLAERDWFREMLGEPDPRRRLELFARGSCGVKRRTAALTEVVRRAAQTDAEIGEAWQVVHEQITADHRTLVESLVARGALRADLDGDGAVEIMGLLNHPSVYYLAVVDRGWPEERFERWLADALIRQLLRER